MNALCRLSAIEAAKKLARREITAVQYLNACLERIDERERDVRAFAYLGREQAIAAARALDAGPVQGPLHGLPVAVKDIFNTRDMPTQGGSKVYVGHQPLTDAACLALAKHAGAYLIGKTVTAELATFPPNETRNPLNLGHTPGGSSSGSCASVADFMVPLATGTQTFGSIVRPAGYCGVIGYKPTYNLIPKKGVWADSDTLDTVGLIARNVPDVALFAAGMLGYPGLMVADDGPGGITAPRIGVCRTHVWDKAAPEMKAALENAAKTLSAAGATVKDLTLPEGFQALTEAQRHVAIWEIGRSLAYELFEHGDELRPALRDRCAQAFEVKPEDYHRSIALGREYRQRVSHAFGDCDVLLTPAATGEAPKGLESTGDASFCNMWTFLHVPCVGMPGGKGPNGLPLGLQVVGRLDDDARTLAWAHWIHERIWK